MPPTEAEIKALPKCKCGQKPIQSKHYSLGVACPNLLCPNFANVSHAQWRLLMTPDAKPEMTVEQAVKVLEEIRVLANESVGVVLTEQEIRREKFKYSWFCGYCGLKFDNEPDQATRDEEVEKHQKTCTKHPVYLMTQKLTSAEAKVANLQAELVSSKARVEDLQKDAAEADETRGKMVKEIDSLKQQLVSSTALLHSAEESAAKLDKANKSLAGTVEELSESLSDRDVSCASLKQQFAALSAPVGDEELEKAVKNLRMEGTDYANDLDTLIRAARQRAEPREEAVKWAESIRKAYEDGESMFTLAINFADSILAQSAAWLRICRVREMPGTHCPGCHPSKRGDSTHFGGTIEHREVTP